MKRVKARCSICGKPFRKRAKDRYHAWHLKKLRNRSTEFCNRCNKELAHEK